MEEIKTYSAGLIGLLENSFEVLDRQVNDDLVATGQKIKSVKDTLYESKDRVMRVVVYMND